MNRQHPSDSDHAEPIFSSPYASLCPAFTYDSVAYLYDNGVLLAIFDENDNVVDLFVNGPQGLVAAYNQNDNSKLYYYLNDHLGSPRVIMAGAAGQQPQVVRYYNYGPYGELLESWGTYASELMFTGKELDDESTFDLYCFGSRYYDSRIGMFTSVDKAGQFAGGYVYGGNNPTLGIDPDGNIFGLAFGLAALVWKPALIGAITSTATYTAFNADKEWTWDGLFHSAAFGAATGAIGAVGSAATNGVTGLLGGQAGTSALRGAFGTGVGAAVSNVGMAYARGARDGSLWKYAASGFATGVFGSSGGFGLGRLNKDKWYGIFSRLGYQAGTTYMRSVGDNWAAGMAKPASNVMVGLGPFNFRIGKGEKLLNYRDNQFQIWHDVAGFISSVSPIGGTANGLDWDWRSLSFNWKGGIPYIYQQMTFVDAQGSFSIYDANGSWEVLHEGTHVWQSRAMGDLWYSSYIYNTMTSGYRQNYWEQVAYNDYNMQY